MADSEDNSKAKEEKKSEEAKQEGRSLKVHSANEWEKADLGDDKRKERFLRLMGAAKKEHHGRFFIGDRRADHGRKDEVVQKVNTDLEKQYVDSMQKKITLGKKRGLGFTLPEPAAPEQSESGETLKEDSKNISDQHGRDRQMRPEKQDTGDHENNGDRSSDQRGHRDKRDRPSESRGDRKDYRDRSGDYRSHKQDRDRSDDRQGHHNRRNDYREHGHNYRENRGNYPRQNNRDERGYGTQGNNPNWAGYQQGGPTGFQQGAPGGFQQVAPGGYQQGAPGGFQQVAPGGYQQGAPGGFQQVAPGAYPPSGWYPQGGGYQQGGWGQQAAGIAQPTPDYTGYQPGYPQNTASTQSNPSQGLGNNSQTSQSSDPKSKFQMSFVKASD